MPIESTAQPTADAGAPVAAITAPRLCHPSREAAALLGVSLRTLAKLPIRPVRLDTGGLRYLRADLERYLAELAASRRPA